MAKIIPFKAIRPTADKVALVTTRSYDDYTAAELASWLDFNPFSFLHIINPAYVNQQKIGIEQRFKMVQTKYNDFKRDAIFIQDPSPSFYLYKIEAKNHTFIGFMAGTSIEEYKQNVIKKHENTLEYRVSTLKDYFKISGFNTEPVLMMHPENQELSKWIKNYQSHPPLYEFSTTNKEKHTLWRIDNTDDIKTIQTFFEEFDYLYIADGHHRSEASLMLHQADSSKESLHYFMSYLICETHIKINEYNRVIHDLNNHSVASFLEKISKDFDIKVIEQQLWKPVEKFQFGMYLEGKYYKLILKNPPTNATGIDTIDAQVLYNKILHPILNIEDLRTDSRIDYIPGNENIIEMFKKIDNGEYKVGFTLVPPNIEEIKYLANHNLSMPPKSTYIEPKLRNGLIIYEF